MGAKFGTLVHAVLETADPFAADLAAELEAQIREHAVWWPVDVPAAELAAAMVPMHDTPLGPLADGLTLRQIGLQGPDAGDGLRIPLGRWRSAGRGAGHPAVARRRAAAGTSARGRPAGVVRGPADGSGAGRPAAEGLPVGLGGRGAAHPAHRYVVVDYKTNWLGDPARAADGRRLRRSRGWSRRCCIRTTRCRRCCTALCCTGSCGGGSPATTPDKHLGGVMYLFLRGMCGPDTPVVDGHPAGVFSWQPPAALITAMSDLLDEGQGGRMTTVGMAAGTRRDGPAAGVQRRGGARVVGCPCGAAAYRAGEGARRDASRWPSRSRCGRCGTGRCASTCGRSSEQVGVRRAAVAGRRRLAGGRSRRARWPARRRRCACDGRPALPRPVLAGRAAGRRRRAAR